MNQIIVPDLSGSDSENIKELYRYFDDLYMEMKVELTAMRRQLDTIINNLRGGETG